MSGKKPMQIPSEIGYIFRKREHIPETYGAGKQRNICNLSRETVRYHLEYLINYIFPGIEDALLADAFIKLLRSFIKKDVKTASIPNDIGCYEIKGLDRFASNFSEVLDALYDGYAVILLADKNDIPGICAFLEIIFEAGVPRDNFFVLINEPLKRNHRTVSGISDRTN